MPTVSVIVPNYCHAPYLEQRIESILQQTFQDFELILLDDCSTDGSREILERYRNHPKVSGIFYNERNSGSPFKQWKKGLSKATGDYVWIAESDDFSSPCFLERCVRILDTRPDCSIVFTSSYIVDSHSRTIREEAPVKYPKQPFLPLPFSLPEEHHLQRRNGTGAAQCAPCGRQLHPIPLLRRLAVLDTDRIGGGKMSSILPNPSTTTGYMTATPPQNRSSRDASTSKRSASSKKPSDS
mgnify:CR=1 FL=1